MSTPRFRPSRVLAALVSHGVRFVVIGGFAASLRGSPLITYDLDVCYSRDDENLERLAAALRELEATLRGVDEDIPFRLDAVTLRNGDSFTFVTAAGSLDILGTPAGTSGFEDLNAASTDVDLGEGIGVRVASVDDLMRMKRAAGRTKDLLGLEWLAALRERVQGEGAEEGA